ncbi:Uroporphyrinogen decarboxylase (URO-D) [Neomoorella glycerini]|uniref:Uroporphyrinogen decarboxylase (URO-D) n=1 Tax=Neomoorella glycerini TaxID=55779 RepID=A0A6I5ZMQ7_9FIRM|nr:uroporphyrinogen decarboxylase family protein [Moorella glycerini]QGP91148.1 Uroporphyrinogen decarboxylase (URO-D) [Moorella glycerini]
MTTSPEKLLAERRQRILDAYDMKVPDRVPITLNFSYMLARLGGVTKQELHDNPDKAQELLEKWALYYQPDAAFGIGTFGTHMPSVILGDRQTKWPGYGLGPDQPFQFVEGEFMKAEEYDEFIEDPSDFTLRKFVPRIYSALEGFADLPVLTSFLRGYGGLAGVAVLNKPSLRSALEALLKVADWYAQSATRTAEYARRMEALGFPVDVRVFGATTLAPFDLLADNLRGMRGVFLDMYRCPDKLLAAQEKIRRFSVEQVIQTTSATGRKLIFIPLHRGSDGFMSIEQFETFYWPQLKALMLDLIKAGLKPYPFYEGVWDQRLEYLRELPKGKTIGMFQSSNMFKVKEIVGDVMTIVGGFPVSLLEGGSHEQVREYTRKMCKALGKNGGFIMSASVALDECNPELVKVWVDATKEYGTAV